MEKIKDSKAVGFFGRGKKRKERNKPGPYGRQSRAAPEIGSELQEECVLGGTIAPKKEALALFKHGVAILAGARRARLDRRDAARAGSAAAASSGAGVNTSAIAELLAVAQLWAADGGCPDAGVWPRRGPLLENCTGFFPGTRLRD